MTLRARRRARIAALAELDAADTLARLEARVLELEKLGPRVTRLEDAAPIVRAEADRIYRGRNTP